MGIARRWFVAGVAVVALVVVACGSSATATQRPTLTPNPAPAATLDAKTDPMRFPLLVNGLSPAHFHSLVMAIAIRAREELYPDD